MSHNNYTYIDTVCPECKHDVILRDNIREETYCTSCGLIIEDNTIPQLTQIIAISQREKQQEEQNL